MSDVVFDDETQIEITNVPTTLHPDMDVQILGKLFVAFQAPGPWLDEPVGDVLRSSLAFVENRVLIPLAPFAHLPAPPLP